MNKLKLSFLAILFLIVLVISCNNERNNNPGIETDPDLGKSLKELAKENPNIIRRNDTIPFDRFTFNNKVYTSLTKDSIILHSIDFYSVDEERILVRLSNGDLAIATHVGDDKYESSDYTINILGNDSIEVIEYYKNRVVFKGVSR